MSVEQDLIQIMQARYGRDVRQSIHDAIYDINEVAKDAQYHASTSTASAQAYANAALASERAAADAQAAAEAAAAEAMSGTPAGYADLVALVDDTQVNHATGDSLALVDTVEGNALAKIIYGMSTQNGTPTPSSPVEIKSAKADFKVVGKNLYDINSRNSDRVNAGVTCTIDKINQTITFNGTATSNAANPGANFDNTDKFIKASVDDKITISCKIIGGSVTRASNNMATYLNMPNGNKGPIYSSKTPSVGEIATGTFTVTQDMLTDDGYLMAGSIQVWMNTGDVYNNLVMAWQIERGDTATDLEPYHSVNQSTDLTLRAIEVTSSDSYNLEKDGKYYIADTLDWGEANGFKVTRRIGTFTLDGSEDGWNLSSSPRRFDRRMISYGYQMPLTGAGQLSTHFEVLGNNNGTWGHFYYSPTAGFIVIQDNNSQMADLTAFKSWLSSNKPTFYFALTTPYEETITPEQALSLLSLKTYDTATSIDGTGDVAPVIELHYAKNETTAKALTGHNEGFKAQEFEAIYGVKNLNSYPYYETTKETNGITFTDNGTGVIKANGTATAETYFTCHTRGQGELNDLTIPNGRYILTGCPNGGSSSTYDVRISITKNGSNSNLGYDMGNSVIVDINGDDYYADKASVQIQICIRNGASVNNLEFKPMLRLATIQDDSYTEYAMSNLELTKAVQDLIARVTTLEG